MCEWYSNWTHIPGAPTIPDDSPLRTYKDVGGSDWTVKNPWRAPGTAPIFSPCGIDGGNPKGCQHPDGSPVSKDGSGCGGGGYGHGPDSREIEWTSVVTTEWKAGAKVKVGWSIAANHGGGYSVSEILNSSAWLVAVRSSGVQNRPPSG